MPPRLPTTHLPRSKYNDAARAEGKPMRYVYRHLYRPNDGMFCTIPEGMLDVAQGTFIEVRVGSFVFWFVAVFAYFALIIYMR